MKRYIQIAALAGLVVLVQLITAWSGKSFYLTQLTMSAYYVVVIMGLCLLMGYTGQISLGHAGFFALGGYISGAMTTHNLAAYKGSAIISIFSKLGLLVERTSLYGSRILHFQPWFACIVAVVFIVAIAYLIGVPVLKLKGHYLAMATLGFGIIVSTIVVGADIFGRADGISEVPAFTLLPGLAVSGNLSARVSNYYIAWGLVIACSVLFLNLVDSRVGRALRAIHGAEDAAEAMGVDIGAYKIRMFVLSAAVAGLAGVLLTHYNGGIGPSEASEMKSVRYVAIVAVGGMANLWGAIVMGTVLNFLSLRGYFGSLDDAVFGGILILIMLFAPQGLIRRETFSDIRGVFKRLHGHKESKR